MISKRALLLALTAIGLAAASPVAAQTYPSRPITIVVPFPAGGPVDVVGRLLAERMRNAGKYTMADVMAYRLRARPARTAAATGTLVVVAFYLIAQMIAARRLVVRLHVEHVYGIFLDSPPGG